MNDPTYPRLKARATGLTSVEMVVAGAYFIVFPFFFFYHSLAALGFISLFLGNWWTASHILLLAFLIPVFVVKIGKKDVFLHIPIAILILICVIISSYQYINGDSYARGAIPFIYSAKMITGWLAFYLLGLFIPLNQRFATVLAVSCGAMFILTVFLVEAGALQLYQYLSQAFVFSAIIPLAVFWSDRRGVVVGGLTLAALIYLASRSELVGFSMVLVGLMVLMAIHRCWTLILAMGATALLAAALITAALTGPATVRIWWERMEIVSRSPAPVTRTERSIESQDSLKPREAAPPPPPSSVGDPIARQLELGDLGNSRSFQIRLEFLKSGWEGIMSNPFWGDYAGQIREFNDPGSYIHNILSAWRQYGLVSFVLYTIFCLAAACLPIWKVLVGKETSPHWLLAAMVGGYCLVLVVATKAVFWPVPALAWGLLASRYQEMKCAS